MRRSAEQLQFFFTEKAAAKCDSSPIHGRSNELIHKIQDFSQVMTILPDSSDLPVQALTDLPEPEYYC